MKKSKEMTKSICMISLLLVFCLGQIFAAECGDVNANGDIDIVDALMIAQYYVDLNPANFDSTVADVDGNSGIDIVDALLVAQYYVDLIDELTGCSSAMTPAPTPVPVEPEIVFAVNCGGAAYVGSDGTEFEADRGYSGGSAYDNGSSVSGTSDPTLYSTERYGDSEYSVPVPKGEYLVTLYFAENYHTSAGSRIFNVSIEGIQAIGNLDIYAKAGGNTAYVTENSVTVSDGEINIEFSTVTENAMVNAIKITALSFSGEPVADFSISPTYVGPGDTVTVDASASYDPDGTITHYQVNFGDGYSANGIITSHVYNNAGTYTITVTVTDNEGKTDATGKIVVVSEAPSCEETRPPSTPQGSLNQVSRSLWARNVPSEVNMYIYVPGAPSSKPPIVVSCHSCGNSASGQFNNNQKIVAAANKVGFIMIFPDNSQKNCWDVGSNASLTHDGGGDTQAIAQMVQYTLTTYNADPDRVYIMGGSSGAMMTQAMLAVYPEIFKGGSARAGVPAGCWADGYSASNQWCGNCAGGNTIKTAQAWGDQARGMYPGYNGPRPRIQLYHGMVDTTISYKNMGEAIKQWTNVLGLSSSPAYEDTISPPNAGYTYERKFWEDECGFIVFETWSSPGNGHSMSYEENAILAFFGLEEFSCFDPEVTACSP
ncbi:MAG: PHB depolymerase family esterase [Spirochaetales bacterium]|nr:PHB depolymerase family esterase [Spirochaetales bacterium]